MSKKDEKLALYKKAAKELKLGLDDTLIEKVTNGLGPSIYNKDAETVSCSDPSELARVRENFLIKKLGLGEIPAVELDGAIKEVCEKMGSANRKKYRALFYALLVKKFGKESVYA
jgi:hypothetical protein